MKDATYILGKHRKYQCQVCQCSCHRPLQAEDTHVTPFPAPCNRCGAKLPVEFQIVDSAMELERIYGSTVRKLRT